MKRERPRLKRAAAVGDLVADLFRRQGMEGKMEEYRAWLVWEETVGPQIAAHARPVRVRDGVLEVRVDQPVWMQQLQLLKPKIMARLNERLGQAVLRDIFWRRGAVEAAATKKMEAEFAWRSTPLSAGDETRIEETVAPLNDPDLRQGLRELLARQCRLDKTKRGLKG